MVMVLTGVTEVMVVMVMEGIGVTAMAVLKVANVNTDMNIQR